MKYAVFTMNILKNLIHFINSSCKKSWRNNSRSMFGSKSKHIQTKIVRLIKDILSIQFNLRKGRVQRRLKNMLTIVKACREDSRVWAI